MRPIDADALKELFSEVIGRIAKKPEMNGNLEHMIRASAMVIQMIDDAPSIQSDTTTHDSIPAETGKNDGDKTSGDCISRTQAIDAIVNCTNCGTEDVLRAYVVKHSLENGWTGGIVDALDAIEQLPSAQPETAKRIVGKSRGGMTLWYQCDTCNEPVDAQDNYCRGCGRRLIDG